MIASMLRMRVAQRVCAEWGMPGCQGMEGDVLSSAS